MVMVPIGSPLQRTKKPFGRTSTVSQDSRLQLKLQWACIRLGYDLVRTRNGTILTSSLSVIYSASATPTTKVLLSIFTLLESCASPLPIQTSAVATAFPSFTHPPSSRTFGSCFSICWSVRDIPKTYKSREQ